MPIQVNCPACGRPLRVPDQLIGQKVKCPGCSEQFVAAGQGPEPPRPEESIRAAEDLPPRRNDEPARQETETYRPAGAEPRRPSRLPRIDDYDDDDFDDEYPRRRRRRPNREAAMARVAGPANGLIATGVIGIILCILGVAATFIPDNGPAGGGGGGAVMADAAGNIVGSVVGIGACVIVLVGAQKMKNLESYGLAKAAAIIAIIPCVSPCCILGIPFGIQALNALNEPDVKEAFGA